MWAPKEEKRKESRPPPNLHRKPVEPAQKKRREKDTTKGRISSASSGPRNGERKKESRRPCWPAKEKKEKKKRKERGGVVAGNTLVIYWGEIEEEGGRGEVGRFVRLRADDLAETTKRRERRAPCWCCGPHGLEKRGGEKVGGADPSTFAFEKKRGKKGTSRGSRSRSKAVETSGSLKKKKGENPKT